jgi:hypothetical protein
MEEIDLTIPLSSSEIVETFDKSKNYVIVRGENRFDYCTLTDVAPTSRLSFQCKKTLSNIDTRTTSARVTPITLTFQKMNHDEYKVKDPESYKIYVTDDVVAMGRRRRKSRKSKKSKRSKKSRKSRK